MVLIDMDMNEPISNGLIGNGVGEYVVICYSRKRRIDLASSVNTSFLGVTYNHVFASTNVNICIFMHLFYCRWDDKVTATKQTLLSSHFATKRDMLFDWVSFKRNPPIYPISFMRKVATPERVLVSGLIILITIVLLVLPR